jgi:predicted CxxxxCH...CXXCH cytochrome family protein
MNKDNILKYFYLIFFLFIIIFVFWSGCSKLKDGVSAPNPEENKVVVHSDNFLSSHGTYYEEHNLSLNDCKKCHYGSNLAGLSDKTCSCHDFHASGFASAHPTYIKNGHWDITVCKNCHGSDYNGGSINKSCINCHKNGPEVCNLCHGSNNNNAPPKDLNGNTATTFVSVGAHQTHLNTGEKRVGIKCSECHKVPSSLTSPGHVDSNSPAEVIFVDTLANVMTNGSNKAAKVWDSADQTCKNIYCHGNFTNGNNYSPKWTKVGQGESKCGSCHSLPPKEPHVQVTTCSICHNQTVDVNLNIIDKTKHMNGKLNVFNTERTDW